MQLVQSHDDDRRRRLKRVAEALIFASDEPVTAAQIGEVFGRVTGEEGPSQEEVLDVVEALNEGYRRTDRTFEIHTWGGGFRMTTEAAMAPYVQALFADARPKRLSRSLMETLAVLAYRQPTTKPEVDFVRGVDSDYAVRKLLELGLVDVVGRSESLGKPLLYGTTSKFLEQFGLNSLDELPTLREIEELLADPAFSRERAELLHLRTEAHAGATPGAVDEESPTSEQPGTSGVDGPNTTHP